VDNKKSNLVKSMKEKIFNNGIDKNALILPKNNNYKKTEIIKDDGRYLIYYDISEDSEHDQ